MVTEAFLNFLFGIFQSVSTWMSTHLPSPPAFWTDAADAISSVTSSTATTVQWFLPIGPALGVGAAIMGLVVALGLVKLTRRAVSLFTGGGGST